MKEKKKKEGERRKASPKVKQRFPKNMFVFKRDTLKKNNKINLCHQILLT